MKTLSETLKNIINDYGIGILNQDQRMKALLADLAPFEVRKRYLLELSIRADIPKQLIEIRSEVPFVWNLKINSMKKYFKDEYFLDETAIESIFDCWIDVLDVAIQEPSTKNLNDHLNLNELVEGVSFKLVFVEGGSFQMGYPKMNKSITLSNFFIGETQVTQLLWHHIMGNNPSHFSNCNKCPVENVSWNHTQIFIKMLNQKINKNYRLPTDAEWEYAARGGKISKGYIYSGSDNLSDVAWYNQKGNNRVRQVAQKQPNELGIYDMSGNVYEWCGDWWESDYQSMTRLNPKGPKSGYFRVLRGGGWSSNEQSCRCTYRASERPDVRNNCVGFRIALSEIV